MATTASAPSSSPSPVPIPPDLAWQLSDQLGHAYSIVLATTRRELADETLTLAELVALVILDGFPDGLTQTAWGEYQGVSRQRAHIIGNKLDGAGLLEITRDGRSSSVTLSRAGKALIARVQPRASAALAETLGGLSTAEARELSRLLGKLTADS